MQWKTVNLLLVFSITCVLCSAAFTPVIAQPPAGWSGDENFAFLFTANGVSAADSNTTNPIQVNPSENISLSLTIDPLEDVMFYSLAFRIEYLSIPLVNQQENVSQILPAAASAELFNFSFPLTDLLGGGVNLISGTVVGTVIITYATANFTESTVTGTNTTIQDDVVLYVGETGLGALTSVAGMITVGFTVMSVFSLLLALDDFQQGIMAARKMRGAESASEVGIFPKAVILRRKPKKDAEKVSKDELASRVSEAASSAWNEKRCPKCGSKWKSDASECSKCHIDKQEAIQYFSEDISEYAPKALRVVKPKSKVPVGKFSKALKLKPDKGGALAAALTEMGVFQTKTVKVPLKKVAFSGLTIAASYWSWMQIFYAATPSWVDILLTTAAGLVVSVLIGYFMNWLARIPKFGYE
ncbi:MAG: conserved membrane protein of unknown function [Candidatus Thorarchaeota archaeon]|nr:MAG: conserved membrane protein of unknown function [Candidatus Thorarchaeota archaeon]